MKTLLILRHGKAKRGPEYATDEERPLAKRGKRDAERIGQVLQERGLIPDWVISSPAKRAKQTAIRVVEAAGYNGDIDFEGSLYFAGPEAQIAVLQRLPDAAQIVLLVGHNPDLEALVDYLCGQSVSLPTAALVRIDLPIASWTEIGEGTGQVRWVLSPDDLV